MINNIECIRFKNIIRERSFPQIKKVLIKNISDKNLRLFIKVLYNHDIDCIICKLYSMHRQCKGRTCKDCVPSIGYNCDGCKLFICVKCVNTMENSHRDKKRLCITCLQHYL